MGDFFKGWRRKIGCMSLVMALVAMGGWVRSSAIQDTFTIGFGASIQVKLISVSHRLVVASVLAKGIEHPLASLWLSQGASPDLWDLLLRFPDWSCPTLGNRLTSDLYSFGNASMISDNASCAVKWCQIPYWSITIPLTLLSAYLLLTKPLKSTQKKITEFSPCHEART